MCTVDPDVVPLLIGGSKSLGALPTQRRQAIQFKYGDIPEQYGMSSIGAFTAPSKEHKVISTVRRDAQNTPCDSWEIDICVGFAVQKIIAPNWNHMKQLGRSLVIFKVHKEPMVCELFFMPREEVIKTYKDVLPKNLEWVHLYDPETECAFWADLYRPSEKKGHGSGRSKILTDELCGGFGSRHCMASHLLEMLESEPTKKMTDKIRVLTSDCTREECEEFAAQASAKIDKSRRKKERQKGRKKEQKEEQAEEEKKIQALEEELAASSCRAQRIPAPHLQGVDFASMFAKPEAASPKSDDEDSDSD